MLLWWQGTEISVSFTLVPNVPRAKLSLNASENLPVEATSKANCFYLGNSDCTHLMNFN